MKKQHAYSIFKNMTEKDLWFMYEVYQKEPNPIHNRNLKMIINELKNRHK
jgi:hypothetical protein|tara:strand:+ start:1636 stop:1785 length:150 start_codon:yes stop_codon:yes gene_type:complete